MDVKGYIDELAARTNRPRAEIINRIIREHRDRQNTNPTMQPSTLPKVANQ
ncbi:MAG: ribbon-helix-helix protein, CopG family [Gammaproteobacteria bacterium]